jgi:pilus assembly protein CpaB
MKRLLPIILAVILAVIAAGIVFFYTRGAEQRVLDEQQPVAVLVTTGTIPVGMPLGDAVSGGLVESTQVPSTMAPTGAISAVTPENTALLALNTVNPGQILLTSNFVAEMPTTQSVPVPDGMIAISLTFGDPQRVGNFVRPGSEVVVFDTYAGATGQDGSTAGGSVTRVLLPKVSVIAVGDATASGTNPDGTSAAQAPSALLTVAVDQADAEKLIYASQAGSLYLGLLGEGAQIQKSGGTTDGNLFD